MSARASYADWRSASAGDRAAIARAITLVESTRADHRAQAQQLLTRAAAAHRRGRAGSASAACPGAGKSTLHRRARRRT